MDDIPRIAQDLIYRLSHARRILPWKLTKKEIQALRSHSWPGNVRELQNVIERAIVLEQRDGTLAASLKLLRASVWSYRLPPI